MKSFTFLLLFFTATQVFSQTNKVDEVDGCPIFEMPEGDTTYTMKQYYLVIYLSGENRNQDPEKQKEIQEGHLLQINKWAKEGLLSLAGPFGDDTNKRGILIFNVPQKEDVEKLMQQDPAVKSGRLTFEIHPWWGAKGSKLN